jgi:hypothetical protein
MSLVATSLFPEVRPNKGGVCHQMNLKSIDSVTIPENPFLDTEHFPLRTQVYSDGIALPIYFGLLVNESEMSHAGGADQDAAKLAALSLAQLLRQDLRILWRTSAESGPGAVTWHEALTRAVLEFGVYRGGFNLDALKHLADLIHPYLIGRRFEYKFPNPTEPDKLMTEPCEIKWKEQHLLDYVFMPDGRVFDTKGNLIGQLEPDPTRKEA